MTEKWAESLGRRIGWSIGHAVAVVLFYATKLSPRLRKRLHRWAWAK